MKHTTLLSVVKLGLVAASTMLIGACSAGQTAPEPAQVAPRVIVVTATPVPAAVTIEVETKANVIVPEFEAGTLLKGSGDGVFFLTGDGTRQHIYDWDTFLAFGFQQEDIIKVEDEVLAAYPPAGELTRLVVDEQAGFYWVMAGQRFPVTNPGETPTRQIQAFGVPATPISEALAARLAPRNYPETATLLRADDGIYYVNGLTIVPVDPGMVDQAEVVEVPAGFVTGMEVVSTINSTDARLTPDTQAANVRLGPGLDFEAVGVIEQTDTFRAERRTASGNWLQLRYGGETAWIATDLVKPSLELSLLPVIEGMAESLPQAQPAAVTEGGQDDPVEPQPVLCNDVPIRGFGKVWGDNPAVQQQLGCTNSWDGGEQSTAAAVQIFQNGLMLWLESDSVYYADPVYVFFNDGTYQRFGDLGPADPAKIEATPAGFHQIGDKFGKVYWEGTGARVKERLGYAVTEAEDSAGAFQQFNNGRMFWAEAIDQIFVIYDYYTYDQANDTTFQVRSWQSFEDEF